MNLKPKLKYAMDVSFPDIMITESLRSQRKLKRLGAHLLLDPNELWKESKRITSNNRGMTYNFEENKKIDMNVSDSENNSPENFHEANKRFSVVENQDTTLSFAHLLHSPKSKKVNIGDNLEEGKKDKVKYYLQSKFTQKLMVGKVSPHANFEKLKTLSKINHP